MVFLLSKAKMSQVEKIENKNYLEPIESKLSKDYGCKMKRSSLANTLCSNENTSPDFLNNNTKYLFSFENCLFYLIGDSSI